MTPDELSAAPSIMILDSVGLGHHCKDGEIFVHYPNRNAAGDITYGTGFPIGPIPDSYWTSPPNEATAERVNIWGELLRRAS